MISQPRIFVSIPSYRDMETQWTVKDLFERAAHPERIFVGICWQFDPREDLACFAQPYPYPEQVRTIDLYYKESKGLGWARARAFSLWQGEEYTLQIDSHMRFEPGWDDALIEMIGRCPTKKAVLSTYVPRYVPPDDKTRYDGEILRTRLEMFAKPGEPQMIHQTCTQVPLSDTLRSGLYPAPLPIGNFLFAPAEVLEAMPLDPHIRFWGEEITYGARLWTHGWDIYQPDKVVAYHYWRRPTPKGATYRKTDDRDSVRVYKRIRHLLELERSDDPKAIIDMERYGLGSERPLADLWKLAGINWERRTLSEDAKRGQWVIDDRLQMTDDKKDSSLSSVIRPPSSGIPRIFINIASYRDAECQWTVKDLFEKAAYPERIFVGICWQFDPEDDKHCFEVVTRPEQVRIFPVNWREAEGVCWARYQTQLLHEDEEYTLMIDSHMRFVQGWDEMMIDELALCPSEKPVFSCSPMPYTPPDKLSGNLTPTFRRVKPFMNDGNIRCQGEAFDGPLPHPVRGAFLVANFVFSRSDIIKDVPYDPYLYFDQEEITYALRLFTHGWDIYSPCRQFLYHYYNDGNQGRPLHWRDLHAEDYKRIRFLRERGLRRFNHITRYQLADDPITVKELDKYGLGSERTLDEFEAYTGIDFKHKVASDKALRGLFIENLTRYRKSSVRLEQDSGSRKQVSDKKDIASVTSHLSPVTLLEPGDFMPWFMTVDTKHKNRTIELYGGKHVLMAFLPAQHLDYADHFFRELHRQFQTAGLKDCWQIFVMDAGVERLIDIKASLHVPHELWEDPDRAIATALGVTSATVFILNPNLQIEHCFSAMEPVPLAVASFTALSIAKQAWQQRTAQRRVISETVPGIIVPNVFSPEFCNKCIEAFRSGKTFDGTVGAGEAKTYRPDTKVRTDFIVGGELLKEMDDKISRSLLPELEKVFGTEITNRELYKIGLYTGEKKGFFKQHRDNTEPPLGYRRIACTIQLNEDYEGGGLKFPEYDNHIYRPCRGSAIAFPCTVLHEALPVTAGERFIVVAFFHGAEDEAYRRHYQASQNEPLKIKDYEFHSRHTTPSLKKTRWFYKDWWQKKVRVEE